MHFPSVSVAQVGVHRITETPPRVHTVSLEHAPFKTRRVRMFIGKPFGERERIDRKSSPVLY